jgi:hypothetical protein
MGIINVVVASIVLFSILGGTIWISRLGLERFINFFLQRKENNG